MLRLRRIVLLFRCWLQSGFIALVEHMPLLCFAVESDVSLPIVNNCGCSSLCSICNPRGFALVFVQNIPSVVVVDCWTCRELVQTTLCIRRRRFTTVDPSPPWLDICFPFPLETNEESASCTFDTAIITLRRGTLGGSLRLKDGPFTFSFF